MFFFWSIEGLGKESMILCEAVKGVIQTGNWLASTNGLCQGKQGDPAKTEL